MIRLTRGKPAVVLAPMEGVTDAPMRALLTERGGFTYCVTEFFRISQDVPYRSTIVAHIPELATGSRTPSGTPVQVQLLGGDAVKLAEAARRAAAAGALAIDLNFGCPAPTVNRNDGGATLLKHPKRIREIVSAVRGAVPREVPVSAKMRLGWSDMGDIHENAAMAVEGGADWLTIHGRTKEQGYKPPAYWGPIGEVARRVPIPVVANGELWTVDDLRRCRDETGCEHFMIGRSALADPDLAHKFSAELGIAPLPRERQVALEWLPLLRRFADIATPFADNPNFAACRIKQWLRMAAQQRKTTVPAEIARAASLDELFSRLSDRVAAAPALFQ